MKLNLRKPLIFFDLETTGISATKDRIVQLGYIKVMPNGSEEQGNFFINPEMHIPEEASAIHHITDEMVADKPTFKQMAGRLEQIFKGCDVAGYNSNRFDVPLLVEEFLRFYCGKELDGAHSADCDIRATYEVLQAQLDRYDDLENDVEWLQDFTRMNRNVDPMGAMVYDDKNRPVFNFGKYKGWDVAEILRKDPGYYSWMLGGDFTNNTKQALTRIRLREMQK